MRTFAIVVSLVLTAITVPVLVKAILDMTAVIRAGQPAIGRSDKPASRSLTMLKETVGHTRMLQWTAIGIMHWFVFAAFIFLSTAVASAFFQIFDAEFVWPLIGHWYPYEWFSEIIGLLSTIGIIYLIIYRQVKHPRRLQRGSRFYGSSFWQAYFVEILAMAEGAAILFIRGAEFNLGQALGHDSATRGHFPLASWIGDLYPSSAAANENIIYFVAMFKIVLALVWLLVISRNLTMGIAWHRFLAWPNIWFKRESDGGTALGAAKPLYVKGKPLDLEAMDDLEEEDFEKLGVGKVQDFTWKGILDFSTCTECGRCQSQCPAWATDKPLSPKLLMMGLRDHAYATIPLLDISEDQRTEEQQAQLDRPLIATEDMFGVIDPDVLWSCTNCGACVQQCPVDIEHVDHIVDMRRYQVLVESNFPSELNNIFKGLERKGNPWNMDPKGRLDWTKGLDFPVLQVGRDLEDLDSVEWLFWVGCAGAFEDRAKKTTQAVAELLNTAGVTFGILGDGETCTGDPARRAGNEIVFQQLAMQNVETFKETKVKKVVSTCAHCFNTLKNEYSELGIELEVIHHTQLLNRLVREGKLTPVAAPAGKVAEKTITYHDPCFLGRHNQVYEAPRELLGAIPGATFKEMPRNKEKSFCCGAGGARMWMEETIGTRINVNRTEEAVATGADQIAVGCPFCRVMLSDGLTLQQSEGNARPEVEILDVAQMLLASIKRAPEPAETADVVAEAEQATAAAAVSESASPAEPDAAAPAPADDPDADGTTLSASEKEAAAEANVGPVNTGTAEPEVAEPEAATPEPEPVKDEQVVDSAAEITSVEDGAMPDSVADDVAPLENASPTAEEVSSGADKAAAHEQLSFEDADDEATNEAPKVAEKPTVGPESDVDTQQADDDFEGNKFMIAEGGSHDPRPNPLEAPEAPEDPEKA